MTKLLVLERNVMTRALPILLALIVVGGATYALMVLSAMGSSTQGIAAAICGLAMAMLVGFACALLLFHKGLQRLRRGC